MLLNRLSLKQRLALVVCTIGIGIAAGFAAYTYRVAIDAARQDSRAAGLDLVGRTAQTFVVATQRFHSEFAKSKDLNDRKHVLDQWMQAITVVTSSVSHDFGADQARVRVIGDPSLELPPLGKDEVRVEIPFERTALDALRNGAPVYEAEDDGRMRFSAALWSDTHQGCGECHIAALRGVSATSDKKVLLGSLNVYVPLEKPMAKARAHAWTTVILISAATLLLTIAVLVYVNRKVVRPVEQVANSLEKAGRQVSASVETFSGTSRKLASDAEEQAESVREAASSLGELTELARSNRERSTQAESITADAKEMMANSASEMEDLTRSIREIESASQETQRIIRSIDEIAFQTNILALNAAVEAARAGEAGAGFAVVATEVRSLAQRAADAARDTASLIETTVSKTATGARLAEKTRADHAGVAQRAGEVARINSEIAAGSTNEWQGIESIGESMRRIEMLVNDVAGNASETASASAGLSAQAEVMEKAVSELYRLVH